jgi:secreted trypsin-like serine protease
VGSNCGSSIPGISSCNVTVTFNPTAPGAVGGSVFVTSGATPVSASLAGTGINAPLVILPAPIDLGAAVLGISNPTETVTLTNTGNAVLVFSSITVTPPFTLDNGCPTSLAPGASCALVIGIESNAIGTFSGTLTIVSNGGSGTVPLSAIVQPVPVALLKVAPTQVGFGDRVVGTASASQQIAIKNEGGQAAQITGLNTSPDFVVVGNTCGALLAPQSTCFVNVAMKAVGFGQRIGQLVVGSNASNAPLTISLSGTGCRPFSALANRGGARSNCSP